MRIDLFANEMVFSYVTNELNSMSICHGTNYKNLEKAEIITRACPLLGRNNQWALAGFPLDSDWSIWVMVLDKVSKKCWSTWCEEMLVHLGTSSLTPRNG